MGTDAYKGKRVLLLDGYGRQIPSLLHQLRGLGCRVTTMCESRWDVGWTSRYPAKRVVVHGIREDAGIYEAAVRRELESGYDILFPVLERATDFCTDGRIGALHPGLKIIAAPREAFLQAYDKQRTMAACMGNGIPCPRTKLDDESLEEFLAAARFPLAAKPRRGSGSAGFLKIHDRAQLEALMASGDIVPSEYVIQEFIPQNTHMCNCYVMMGEGGRAVFAVTIQTYRWYPIDGGPGCFARTVDMPEVRENAVRLFWALGWKGFGQVSFIMDARDGVAKVLEINGRISAGVKIVELAGCQPVRCLLDQAYGVEPPVRTEPIREGLGLRYFHTDIMWLLKSPNRFSARPSWFDFRRNHDYIFSWADPLPFFGYAVEHAMTYRKDMARRKH